MKLVLELGKKAGFLPCPIQGLFSLSKVFLPLEKISAKMQTEEPLARTKCSPELKMNRCFRKEGREAVKRILNFRLRNLSSFDGKGNREPLRGF